MEGRIEVTHQGAAEAEPRDGVAAEVAGEPEEETDGDLPAKRHVDDGEVMHGRGS